MTDALNYDYIISSRRVTEFKVQGKPLGRHVRHDSRSLAYRYQRRSAAPLVTSLIERYIPILDQGQMRSCTANAGVGCLGTGALWNSLPPGTGANGKPILDEFLAVHVYSQEEQLLFGDPNTDQGGDGLTICKVMQASGFIAGYTHCFALNDVLEALNDGQALMIGSEWYDSFDMPSSSGLIEISPNAVSRGGHEYEARGINVEEQKIFCDNSWGLSYGLRGSMEMSWDTLARLLSEQGDATVPAPLAIPGQPVTVSAGAATVGTDVT